MLITTSWRSPSNIALVKYWGKREIQLPQNPSLSFTLSACHTDMGVNVEPEAGSPMVVVLYNGNEAPAFEPKVSSFLKRLYEQLPWIKNASIKIDSVNTFPHAAGIASSASSMSALALCLADIDDQIHARAEVMKDENWWKRVSEIARLGSGSACRSLFPIASLWGKVDHIPASSDQYAIPWVEQIAPVYHTYHDTILVVSSSEKKVSSSAGHDLMNDLPYADARYNQATKNIDRLTACMQSENDLQTFISICESEALQLHALMMMSSKPYLLMQPQTVSIINDIWKFRMENDIPLCFTLDAGPNVHLLYPGEHKTIVHDFIQSDLLQYCQDGIFILDEVGNGPIKLQV